MLQPQPYSSVLQFRVPADIQAAVIQLAVQNCTSVSAVIRQALAERLRREGVAVPGISAQQRKD